MLVYLERRAIEMKKTSLWLFLFFALFLAGCGNQESNSFERLLTVKNLFRKDRIVSNFSNMSDMFLVNKFTFETKASTLNLGKVLSFNSGFDKWRTNRNLTAIVVLKHGDIVYEDYYLGTKQSDQRISWSVAKSYISVLIGIAIDRGQINSIEDLASDYAPEIRGTPYEQVAIKDLLQMSSGVIFDENYGRYNSDINKMSRILALGGSMDKFALEQRKRHAEPGEIWKYVSIDTHILGLVLRRATGQNLSDLMAEYILKPLGTTGSPYFITDSQGVAFALGGLNLTTRDYAKFGEMVRQNGIFQGHRIVSENWIIESTTPSANTPSNAFQYGYQWWAPPDANNGEFFAYGVYGQCIYIDKSFGVVIAINAADRNFGKKGMLEDYISGFRAIVAKIQKG